MAFSEPRYCKVSFANVFCAALNWIEKNEAGLDLKRSETRYS